MSDLFLVDEYLGGNTLTKTVTDKNDSSVANETNANFGDAVSRICTILSESEGSYTFSCVEYHYWFGTFTLVFIFGPSVNVLAAILGPRTGGVLSLVWAIVMLLVSGTLAILEWTSIIAGESVAVVKVMVSFLFSFGIIMGLVGMVHAAPILSSRSQVWKEMKKHWIWLIFCPLIIVSSPLILMLIMTLSLLRPESQFLRSQKKIAKSGESLLEATPQLCLQLFIILRTMNPSWKQNYSIVTSALSIAISNVDQYLETRGQELGPNKATSKCFLVVFPQSFFRVISVSIFVVFFDAITPLIIVGFMIVWAVLAQTVSYCFNKEEWQRLEFRTFLKLVLRPQFIESYLLSFITITNIDLTGQATLLRLLSTYYIFTAYTISLTVIVTICNINPDLASVAIHGTTNGEKWVTNDIVWSELELVKNIFNLNLITGITISTGLVSVLLDLLLGCCDEGKLNWNNTVLHEGIKYMKEKNSK